jgi:nucleoid DNA-binding protein
MTKAEIIQDIVNRKGADIATITAIVDTLLGVTGIYGDKLYLMGMGAFQLVERNSLSQGATARDILVNIPAHFTPAYFPSEELLAKAVKSNS